MADKVKISKKAIRHYMDSLKDKFPIPFKDIDMNSVEFYLDEDSEPADIIDAFSADINKFALIIRTILTGQYNSDLYKKEGEGVYAMRFIGTINTRVYCKDFIRESDKKKVVVMSRIVQNKTSEKNNKKNNPIIEAIQNYDFTLIETRKKEDEKE